jgi:hypothetical protein
MDEHFYRSNRRHPRAVEAEYAGEVASQSVVALSAIILLRHGLGKPARAEPSARKRFSTNSRKASIALPHPGASLSALFPVAGLASSAFWAISA